MSNSQPIEVLFFASLCEQTGRDSATLDASLAATVADVWQQLCPTLDMPVNTLMAVNQINAKADSAVAGGDEVAFFPPVTGG